MLPAVDNAKGNPAASPEKDRYSRKNTLLASVLILVSGISGTAYLNFAKQPAYGPLAFLQGPQVMLPAQAVPLLLVEVLLFISLALAPVGFFLFASFNVSGNQKLKHARAFRIAGILLVITYAEALLGLVVSAVLGISRTESFPTIVYGAGNLFNNSLYMGSLILLFSFLIFIVAGSLLGTSGSVFNSYILSGRHEFILIAPFLFGGIFYFPFLIVAGLLGIFTALTETSYLKRYSVYAWHTLSRASNNFLSNSLLEFLALGASGLSLILLFYISTFIIPVYAGGTLIFYNSKYVGGPSMIPMELGLFATSALLVTSLLSIFRTRLKIMISLVFAVIMLTASVYVYYLFTLQHSLGYVQLSRFETTYVGLPFIMYGIVFGMILPIFYFSDRKKFDSSTT